MEKLQEIYDSLVELGVVFYYGSNTVSQGEITDIKFHCWGIEIEINEEYLYNISYEEFEENHSKEGNNYHTWTLSRQFDNVIEKYL